MRAYIPPMGLSIAFEYYGTALKQDIEEFYFFFSGSGCHGYCFKSDPSIIFLIDGERMNLKTKLGDNSLSDYALFIVQRDEVERMAKAKKLEYQVGHFEGVIKAKQIDRIRQVLAAGTVSK